MRLRRLTTPEAPCGTSRFLENPDRGGDGSGPFSSSYSRMAELTMFSSTLGLSPMPSRCTISPISASVNPFCTHFCRKSVVMTMVVAHSVGIPSRRRTEASKKGSSAIT